MRRPTVLGEALRHTHQRTRVTRLPCLLGIPKLPVRPIQAGSGRFHFEYLACDWLPALEPRSRHVISASARAYNWDPDADAKSIRGQRLRCGAMEARYPGGPVPSSHEDGTADQQRVTRGEPLFQA